MNRIFKVIWSKTKHCYIVVSEYAKANTKAAHTGLRTTAAAAAVAAMLLAPVNYNYAWAADPTVKVTDTNKTQQTVYTTDGADNTFATKGSLTTEAASREAADTKEAGIREAADTKEAAAREAADTTEAADRAAADTTLQSNIDKEATARETADTKLQTAVDAKANAADVYSKTDTDTKLADKANAADVYSKTDTDNKLADKANAADVYSKTDTDTKLADKANVADVYSKADADTTFATKTEVSKADTDLQKSIDEEARKRKYSVTNLEKADANEAAAREAADTQLDSRTSAVETKTASLTRVAAANSTSINESMTYKGNQYSATLQVNGSGAQIGVVNKEAAGLANDGGTAYTEYRARTGAIVSKATNDISSTSSNGQIIDTAGDTAGEYSQVATAKSTGTTFTYNDGTSSSSTTIKGNAISTGSIDATGNISAASVVDNTLTSGNYVTAGNTVGENIVALDTQAKANADAIDEEARKRKYSVTNLEKADQQLQTNINNEAAAREAGDKALDDRITNVKEYLENQTSENYVSKADAAVQDAGVVKADKKIGENVTALGKGLYDETAARIGADKAQDKVIEKVNQNMVDGFNTINTNMANGFAALNQADANEAKARADADAAEKAARIGADKKLAEAVNSGISLSADNVLQKNTTNVDADGNVTTKKADVTEMILNKGKDNQITLSDKGIKVGLNSGVMDKDGFYAGGDTAAAAKAALNADGSIKGADGKFTVDADGKVTAASGKIGNVDITSAGAVTGVTDLTASGTITGNKLTDGVASLQNGNLTTTGNINAHDIVATGAITGTTINGTTGTFGSLTTTGNASVGGTLSSNGLTNTGNAITDTLTVHHNATVGGNLAVTGDITGKSLNVGTGAISGGQITGTGLDVGAGTIKTTGAVETGTLETTGNATIGGDLTVDKNLTVNGTFDARTLSSTVDANNYTTINGGKTQSMNLKMDAATGETKASASTFDENGSNTWAKDDDSIGKSTVTADGISQRLSDTGDNPTVYAERTMSQGTDNKYSMVDTVKDGDKTNVATQSAAESSSILADKDGLSSTFKQNVSEILNELHASDTKYAKLDQKADNITSEVKNGENTTSTTQTATDLTNTAKNGTITNDANKLVNTASDTIANTAANNITNTSTDGNIANMAANGTISNAAKNLTNTAAESITNTATNGNISNFAANGTITNDARTIANKAAEAMTNEAKTITSTASESVTTQIGDGSAVKSVMNDAGIANMATGKVLTNDAATITNTGTASVTNQVGSNKVLVDTTHVQSAFGDNIFTTWSESGITNTATDKTVATNAKDIQNTATGDITNSAANGTITNTAKALVNTATGNMTNTVGGKLLNDVTGDLENKVGGNLLNTIMGASNTTVTGNVTEDYKVDLSTKVGGNETHAVTGNQTVTVSKDRKVNVKGTETENFNALETNVKTDQKTSVGGNQTTIVTGNQTNNVSGSKNETVKGSVTEKYGSQATTVDGDQSTNIGGNQTTVVAKDQTNTVSGNKTETVKGAVNETYGSQITKVNGDQSTTVTGKQTNSITGDQVNTIGGNQTTTVTGDSSLSAKNITNTAKNGTISNTAKDILNDASGDIINMAAGEIGNTATKITNITGDTTVTSDTNGTVFGNKSHNKPIDAGTITKTTISGNTLETGKATMDYAEVMKDLGVRGNAVIDQTLTVKGDSDLQGNAAVGKDLTVKGNSDLQGDATVGKNLTVKGDSDLQGNATIGKNLTVGGASTFNDTVTVAKGGLAVTGGTQTDTLHVTGASNFDGMATFKDIVKMEKDLSVGGNATVTGDVTANSYKVGDKTYIDANGINANGQKITNVAAGTEDSDAANYGQLRKVERRVDGVENRVTNVENRVDKMDSRIDKVGANAAAMANLHPLEFDEDSKWNVAAAVGNYKGETAAAVGAFYRPNEDVMFNLSTTFGNDENMVGGGLSLRLGKGGNHEKDKKLKAAIAENNDLRAKVDDLTARMDALLSAINPNMSKEFPDVPENHWAYEAVTRLAGNNIVQGYEDGKFHGERTMTRYEMAEIIYNALSRGAKAEKKLVEEFKPELQAMAAQKQAK